ncbi:MAG: hypothetical protein R3F62_01480 [Planctomycetota bacterium]
MRLASCLALVLLAGVARADLVIETPTTYNAYAFTLVEDEDAPADLHLVLYTYSRPDGGDSKPKFLYQRADQGPVMVPGDRWARGMEHELILVRGKLPEARAQGIGLPGLGDATVVAKVKLTRWLPEYEAAKDENPKFVRQVYHVQVTPQTSDGKTVLKAKRVKVERKDRHGETLETETLDQDLSWRRAPASRGWLAWAGLLGVAGLGGLAANARVAQRRNA